MHVPEFKKPSVLKETHVRSSADSGAVVQPSVEQLQAEIQQLKLALISRNKLLEDICNSPQKAEFIDRIESAKMSPFADVDSLPIPEGICYSQLHGVFYDANGVEPDDDFVAMWTPYRVKFPRTLVPRS